MRGWIFYNDQRDTVCVDVAACHLVDGPAGVPLGTGSAELATSLTSDGKALILADYKGVRLDSITTLSYSTYRQTDDAGNNLAIALQINVDYDLTDLSTGYQGRLVFEPYQGIGGNVPKATWQSWDAKAGRWWGTRATVSRDGALVSNPCVQATPCTWSALLAAFPNIGVHANYGAIVLKAGSGWPSFRGNVDALSIGVGGTTTTFDFEARQPQSFPALPPDSLPSWIYADSNLVDGGAVIAGLIARHALIVAFDPATSGADRAAAIMRVGGTVVGGMPMDGDLEGWYFLQIPAASPAAILAARDTVEAMPGVVMSIPAMRDGWGPDYRLPRDSAAISDYRTNPDSAAGPNWALEAIAAPLAWGCSTGSPSLKVTVIDGLFEDVDDLRPNVAKMTGVYSPITPGSNRHGTAVASILAAKGDNRIGMTGVMWNASLELSLASAYRPGEGKYSQLDVVVKRMGEAANSGARIINVSEFVRYKIAGEADTIRDPIPDSPEGRVYLEKKVKPAMRWVLKQHQKNTPPPLFVFSAGNGGRDAIGRDAELNGFPVIEKEFPDRVLVVAGTDGELSRMNHLAPESNRGARVAIAAPARNVMALEQHGTVAAFFNTSAATPLVSGVAGLLMSFDPQLTVAEVRQYIVDGAIKGGRFSDGYPVLNAYESLKLAAGRIGAPLCGNRMWKNGDDIVVERQGGTEEIVTHLAPQSWQSSFISAYHGGRRFDMDWGREFDLTPFDGPSPTRKFVEGTYHDLGYDFNGGAFLSYDGENHDNTRLVRAEIDNGDGTMVQIRATMKDMSQTIVGTAMSPIIPLQPWRVVCQMRAQVSKSCEQWGRAGDWTELKVGSNVGARLFMAADASDSTRGYVVVNIRIYHATQPPWQPCAEYPDEYECATPQETQESLETRVYLVDFRAGTWTPVPLLGGALSVPRGEIQWIASSEDGTELIWGIGESTRAVNSRDDVCTNQRTQFVSLGKPGYPAGSVIRSVYLPDDAVCSGLYEAGATVAP
jgi:subtilisin family serine protease